MTHNNDNSDSSISSSSSTNYKGRILVDVYSQLSRQELSTLTQLPNDDDHIKEIATMTQNTSHFSYYMIKLSNEIKSFTNRFYDTLNQLNNNINNKTATQILDVYPTLSLSSESSAPGRKTAIVAQVI
jgi:hypothetical protein